jgi:hypothetical protein
MRLDLVQVRVLIGCIFVYIITESETCHVYEVVLQTIKVVARNLSRASKLLARNHIIIQQDWT